MASDILTTVVGGYALPEWIGPHPTTQMLRDAIAVVIKSQELIGLDLLSDGEINRYDLNHPETDGKIDYFIQPLQNVRGKVTRGEQKRFEELTHLRFRLRVAGVVEGQIGEGTLNLPGDFQLARQLTSRPLKFMLTSPYMLGRSVIDRHYHSKEALVNALADVLAGQIREIEAEVVQISDEMITGNPADGPWVADALIRIFASAAHKSALYLGFGNYGGQVIQQGQWSQMIEFINLLHVDHVLLELAHRPAEELSAIRDIRPEIGIGLGVIDVKSTVIETPEEVARSIERAVKALGPGRVCYVSRTAVSGCTSVRG